MATTLPAKVARRLSMTPGQEPEWIEDGMRGFRVVLHTPESAEALAVHEKIMAEYDAVVRALAKWARSVKPEPRWLTDTTVLAIHAQQIERFGGAHGVRDQHVVLSALARPQQRWHYDPSADLADLAALCLVGRSQAQGYVYGNTRAGLACALGFLALNGDVLHVDGSAQYARTMRGATNQANDADVAVHLRERMS